MNVLGTITGGSLTEGLTMKINPEASLETIKTGKFVSITGKRYTFFSLITDLSLEITHPDILLYPPTKYETLLAQTIRSKNIYSTAQLKPLVMLNKNNEISPVKTLPPHFATVHKAQSKDIALIFGDPGSGKIIFL